MKLKPTILAVIITLIITLLFIFIPCIAAWGILALAIFIVIYTLIDLYFYYKN
jgi:hypothetical protein